MVGRRAGTISRINAVKWGEGYREAVSSQSPGLLQPWVNRETLRQPQRGCVTETLRATKQVKKDYRTSDATALRLRETLCDSPRVEATLGFGTEPRCGIFGEAFSQNTKSIAISDQKPSSPIIWVFIIRGAPQTQNALLQRFG